MTQTVTRIVLHEHVFIRMSLNLIFLSNDVPCSSYFDNIFFPIYILFYLIKPMRNFFPIMFSSWQALHITQRILGVFKEAGIKDWLPVWTKTCTFVKYIFITWYYYYRRTHYEFAIILHCHDYLVYCCSVKKKSKLSASLHVSKIMSVQKYSSSFVPKIAHIIIIYYMLNSIKKPWKIRVNENSLRL